MHSAQKSHVQALLDRLEKVHDEVVRDVVGAEGKIVFVVCPTAFNQFGLQAFVFEEAFFKGRINRGLAGQPDEANLHVFRIDHFDGGFFAAAD